MMFPMHADETLIASMLKKLRTDGMKVIGTDEAGRGPLAGPVIAAAVYLTPEQELKLLELGLRDSKKMTPRARERMFKNMQEMGIIWYAQAGSVERIDRMNILKASLWAMWRSSERVICNLLESSLVESNAKFCIVVDGPTPIPAEFEAEAELKTERSFDFENVITQWPLVTADKLVPAVSAASVVAKVLRDRIMLVLDRRYPEYGFARHKGYPTRIHRDAIMRIGLSPIHRRSFCRKYERDSVQFLIHDE